MMIESYMTQLCAAFGTMRATAPLSDGRLVSKDAIGFSGFITMLRTTHEKGCKVMVVGNGGSTAIASHFAIDLCNAAGVRAMTLGDAAAMTCLANDYGFEKVFEKQVEYLGRHGDMLVAISSSGVSPNIRKAASFAMQSSMWVVTFSGFEPTNPLRQIGDLNFYVESKHYGFVELSHQIFLHAAVDALAEARQ